MLHKTKGGSSLYSIGSNIRAFRLNYKYTQEQLAEKLGVTFQAVSKWETNANMPDISLLPRIAKALGITIDELFSDGNAVIPVVTEQIKDDDIIRIVQMKGKQILCVSPMSENHLPIRIQFPYNCNDKTQYFKVEVYGDIISEGAINGDVICHGSIECPAINAVGNIHSDGNIRAHEVNATKSIACKQIQDCYNLKCDSIECSGDIHTINLCCGQALKDVQKGTR